MSRWDDDTRPCPYCRQEVYEDAERCPHCGNYLSEEDRPGGLSGWMYVGAVVCLLVALGWALLVL